MYWLLATNSTRGTDQVFEAIRKKIQDKNRLKTFRYDNETCSSDIQWSEWIGDDRLDSKRRPITNRMSAELIDELKIDDLNVHLHWFVYIIAHS